MSLLGYVYQLKDGSALIVNLRCGMKKYMQQFHAVDTNREHIVAIFRINSNYNKPLKKESYAEKENNNA
jgi:hypothetical protein